MQAIASPSKLSLESPLRLWTIEEYHRMAEVGILQPDEPVELISGQIIRKMSPQKSLHAAAITRTERQLRNGLGDRVLLRIQLPIELNSYSEPEPDIAIVQPDPRDYADNHPIVSQVYAIVEVADTTLRRDCSLKARNYANSGIEDYWVLDIENRQLHLFREPTSEGYNSESILSEDNEVSPLQFPELRIRIQEILPPV
ncbi:Uma2 family endonuclease [Spirulina sp. 06S082]|uniref:Uma2 family endonuclease n=1 Tax=Spirulina sp. 06S082 TaxID=3110248 RepID=UPI002B1F712F|nr:Uma2 family endonuclease [Spirulina sp. 06S082]MEA5470193.1 Uma2 family endonuclease [Spirulina sp. 06S082]